MIGMTNVQLNVRVDEKTAAHFRNLPNHVAGLNLGEFLGKVLRREMRRIWKQKNDGRPFRLPRASA